jgi:SAM-dependent methyltransferase
VWQRGSRAVRYHGEVNDPETPANTDAILAEQIAYYRARAGEYDQWWFRTGRFDRGAELNAAWRGDVAEVERALDAYLERTQPARVLELACGTGLFTRRLAPKVAHLTAIDASPEVIAINRDRVSAGNVAYVESDLFAWLDDRAAHERFDLVFMSFWLSHVPDERLAMFWARVREMLGAAGAAYVIDSAFDPTSTAANHPTPERAAGVVSRLLNDGRGFRIVKIFHTPETLAARLAQFDLRAEIAGTPRYFIHGTVRAG